jgi:hypothetical protein
MIVELATSAMLTCNPVSTPGASEAANFVCSELRRGRASLLETISFGEKTKQTLDELFDLLHSGQNPGWDGYGALPISHESYRLAYQLIENLPLGTPMPSVSADPDGHVSLEWFHSPRRLLSISVSPERELHYAGLFGSSRIHGVEPCFPEMPMSILKLIGRVSTT